jgi:hypothetical protein
MREFIKNLFKKEDSIEHPIAFEFDGVIKFNLKIKDLVIGYLKIEDKKWTFKYSEEFKAQEDYRRLTGFSDLSKVYESDELWPFFKIRIPGLKQPMVKEILEQENLNKSNEAILLRRFGRVSMSNPYILEVE